MSAIKEMTVFVYGEATECLVEYESDYCPAEPSVGIPTDGFAVEITRCVTVERGYIVVIDAKQKSKLEGYIAEALSEEMGDTLERKMAAREDHFDAKRKGEI